jgi:hypothetical protein
MRSRGSACQGGQQPSCLEEVRRGKWLTLVGADDWPARARAVGVLLHLEPLDLSTAAALAEQQLVRADSVVLAHLVRRDHGGAGRVQTLERAEAARLDVVGGLLLRVLGQVV